VSPSINYQEVWYTRKLDYTFNEELNGVEVDTINGFSRAGSWSSGASLNTRFYGTKFFPNWKNSFFTSITIFSFAIIFFCQGLSLQIVQSMEPLISESVLLLQLQFTWEARLEA